MIFERRVFFSLLGVVQRERASPPAWGCFRSRWVRARDRTEQGGARAYECAWAKGWCVVFLSDAMTEGSVKQERGKTFCSLGREKGERERKRRGGGGGGDVSSLTWARGRSIKGLRPLPEMGAQGSKSLWALQTSASAKIFERHWRRAQNARGRAPRGRALKASFADTPRRPPPTSPSKNKIKQAHQKPRVVASTSSSKQQAPRRPRT